VASLTAAAPGAGLRLRLDTTGGNPLYVTELLHALEEDGALRIENGFADTDAETLPTGLVQTLDRRIAALPTGTADALRLASLLGGAFSLDDLAAVAGRSVVDVAGVLREAVDAGLVTGDGSRLAFRHDLIREAVYVGIAPAIRTDLHVAAARALASAGASAAQVARQYAVGARPGDLVVVPNRTDGSWPVDVLAMAHADHEHDEAIVVHLVHDPVATDPDAVGAILALEGHAPRRPRLLCE
jgi:hypothetical protein